MYELFLFNHNWILQLVFRTVGYSGADIRSLVNEAGIMSVRKGHSKIFQQDIIDVLDKQLLEGMGVLLTEEEQQKCEKNVSLEKRRLLAVHEAGHVVLAHLFPRFDWHAFSQLLPGGKETAVSVFYPREEMINKGYTTFGYMMMQMVVAHGGRCAERVVFGDDVTDGGKDDLEKITKVGFIFLSFERELVRKREGSVLRGCLRLTRGHRRSTSHRRSTWGLLNLGSVGASVDSAHQRPVILHSRPSLFFFPSDLLLFFGFLTWLRLLLWVWVPAFSVADGEVSTGGPIVGDLPRRSRVFFPPRFAHLLLVSTFLRLPLKWPAVSVAAGGVLAGDTIVDDFSGHRRVAGVSNFAFFISEVAV
ncbi:hypothetical protein Cgig2_026397 [Carnegiea gigantea]|uniref:Peptidase M41 domain-containing protein n=1 Tax=Carnegiea gigantea TaxID=171969 RepID=A0A9Q1K1Y6_9CARY|nr:hypothetical protein Cgig2_026397 [Carnegiea gigantea]